MIREERSFIHPIELQHVWKRYHLGSEHGTLRDTIPALFKKLVGRNGHDALEDAGQFWAVQDASFHVKKGETLGIIGPNGAGKSTILKLLSKICRQTKGHIHVHGRLAALIEVGAGFHPDLSGRENVYLNGTIMGLKHREIDRMFDSIVAFAELEKFLDMPVKRYSSGMSVRLGFAVAAHVNPDIMLIDEVLAVGDMAFQQKCYQRILDLKARGTTIIFISHNMEAISRICDRVVLMHEGQVKLDDDPATAIASYRKETFRQHRFQKVWTPLGVQISDTSRDIELVGVQLHDGNDMSQETFQTGELVSVMLTYRAKRPIHEPSVTVTIERADGLICHEASTQSSGVSWNQWNGEGTITLEYPALNLLPNTYLINAAVYESQNPVPLARLSEPHYFMVTSEQPTRGAFHLDHVWSLASSQHN